MRSVSVALASSVLLACSGGIPAELAVAPLGTSDSSQALRVASPHAPPEGIDGFAYAQLDGLRIDVQSLTLERDDESRDEVAINEIVELSPGNARVPFAHQVTVPVGDFRSARLDFDASYEVKATCRTENYLVYTTASEVRRIDCATEDCDSGPGADYDFFRYEFLYVTTSDGPLTTGDSEQEETYEPFSIDPLSSPRLAVLVDMSYLVTCYDGSVPIGAGAGVPPFSYHPRGAHTSERFFPSGDAAFGVNYLPLFIWVSDDPGEATPVGETYVAAADRAITDGEEIDMARVLVTTFGFREDGSVVAARARNFDAAQASLNQYFSGFSRTEHGAYTFFNGEFYWDDSEPGRYIRDRRISGFVRSAIGDPSFSTPIADGPECGTSLMTEHGNAARECMQDYDHRELWWRRIERR